jgi:hypothetical protein
VARRLLSNATNVTTQWLTDGYFDINRLETTENALVFDRCSNPANTTRYRSTA